MKYYTSYIYYLDIQKGIDIGDLFITDIDYHKSANKFIFKKGFRRRDYFEELSSILMKDMVSERYCEYTEDNKWTYLEDKALQCEIPFFIDIESETDEIPEEEAKKIIESYGGEKEYLKELERIIITSTRSLALRNNIRTNCFVKLDGKTLQKKIYYL